jgi:hypothetical protein
MGVDVQAKLCAPPKAREGERVNADGYIGERRRHQRFTQPPLSLSLEGRTYATADWSMGGFVIDDYAGALTPGSLFAIDGIAAAGEELTPVGVRARVLRISEDRRRLTVTFLFVDQPAFRVLQRLVGQRIQPAGQPPNASR